MAALRSFLFAAMFYPGTLYYVLSVILVAPFGSRPVQRQVHAWSAYHYWLVRKVLRIRFEWDGEIPDGPYLIAVKHQAMVEAVDTLRFARTPVVDNWKRCQRAATFYKMFYTLWQIIHFLSNLIF